MRVLVAPASLKESLSAAEAARALAEGARCAGAETVELPLADGGRGTLECIAPAMGLLIREVQVTGPLGWPVTATFGLSPDCRTAVMEMASASGLALVPPGQRDAMRATTRGTGELVRAALEAGPARIYLGIGDSATSDGGAGAAQALGFRLLDSGGKDIGPGAAGLARLARIDPHARHPRLGQAEILVACDVDNPLLGRRGAARVFGPQKGAGPNEVRQIQENLAHLAEVIERDLGIDVRTIPGGGAAGGLGAGAVAFLGARLMSGAEWVLGALEIERRLAQADLVLTAEGRFDAQSLGGKAPMTLARRARAAGIPCAVICGSAGPGSEAALSEGVSAIFPLVRENVTLSEAMARPKELLAGRAEEAVRRFARCGSV
jgi:glycerate kinase